MPVHRSTYGLLADGDEIGLYRLEAGDFAVTISDYGATLLSILVPDLRGGKVDVLLGPASLAGLAANRPSFGSSVGRFAGRISGARFTLDGAKYELEANDGPNHLHGGFKGFSKRTWAAEAYEEQGRPSLRLSLVSPAGDGGYPGRLEVDATYGLSSTGALSLVYEAKTDAPTVLNLTNHAYFNLLGEGRGDILGHTLRLACSRYLVSGPDLVPTGEIAGVASGPFDFRSGKIIGLDIGKAEGGAAGKGYDHCFILDRDGSGLVEFAQLAEPRSGRSMTVSTTLPAVQFYTGNFLAGVDGKRGSVYGKYAGLCLETQFYPDAPNKKNFPSVVLKPGERWSHQTVYSFKP
jgi:aldose 1-epimerase